MQAALDVVMAGDVVRMDAGVFAGGVTVNKDLSLVGAGAGATLLRGGGPVLTIGVFDAVTEPTVFIRGLTVTGGLTHTGTRCGRTVPCPTWTQPHSGVVSWWLRVSMARMVRPFRSSTVSLRATAPHRR